MKQPREPQADDGITVAEAARILGCTHTMVRSLANSGQLFAWRVGKTSKPTGIRIQLGSVWEYRDRNSLEVKPQVGDARPRRVRRQVNRAVVEEMLKSLRAKGFRI